MLRRLGLLCAAAQKAAAQRQQHSRAHRHAEQSHGSEREEAGRLVARSGQGIAHNEVGRRTNEREHAAHAPRKGQRHEKARRRQPRTAGQAHHDGQHESHRTRVAHKGSHQRSGEHEQHKDARFPTTCQTQDALAQTFGQSRAENAASHYEEAAHHHHERVRKARQRLLNRQHARQHQPEGGADGYKVGTHTAPGKAQSRHNQNGKCRNHRQKGMSVCRSSGERLEKPPRPTASRAVYPPPHATTKATRLRV